MIRIFAIFVQRRKATYYLLQTWCSNLVLAWSAHDVQDSSQDCGSDAKLWITPRTWHQWYFSRALLKCDSAYNYCLAVKKKARNSPEGTGRRWLSTNSSSSLDWPGGGGIVIWFNASFPPVTVWVQSEEKRLTVSIRWFSANNDSIHLWWRFATTAPFIIKISSPTLAPKGKQNTSWMLRKLPTLSLWLWQQDTSHAC